ncbi:MAG TPA: hypothetical protein VJL61_07615 [Rhodanobacteraceae bacterium]|nr:hypothetical protein [Rhodanobacteraceae bacterium]
MASVFHQSTSDRAFVGRDGWLYFTGNGGLADMQGISPYTETQLQNDVEQINARGELLAVRGIHYGFVVFPDKHTVYPQFLPGGVYAGFEHRRLNALDAAMAQTGHDYYFDATDALHRDAAHSPFRLYYKSDTHWNPWGAYLGYEAWVTASGKRLSLRPFDYRFDQFRTAHQSLRGDLSKISGYRPYDPDIYPPAGAGCGSTKPWNVPGKMLHRLNTIARHMRTAECGGNGTALILHDSFLDSMERYVTDNFKRSWLIWNYPADKDFGWLVDQLHPDTVLVERVERLMLHLRPVDLEALVQELGVVGESAAIDNHGWLKIGSGNNRKALSHESAVGGLDRVVRAGDQVYVEGWVRLGHSPPAAVIAVSSGKVVGEAPVTLYRPEAPSVQRDSVLKWSGFRLHMPAGAVNQDVRTLQFYWVNFDTYGVFVLNNQDQQKLSTANELEVGMLDGRVIENAAGELVVAGSGTMNLHDAGPARGSLDQIAREGDFVRLVGWAGLGEAPASKVIAVVDGQVIGEAPVILRRIDVANAYRNPKMTWSGFEMQFPARALGHHGKALRLYFVSADRFGKYSMDEGDRERLQALLK